MEERFSIPRQTWIGKFRNAFRGVWIGVSSESSIHVQLLLTASVVLAAWFCGLLLWQWCVVLLCVSIVLAAELLNTALERLARAVDTQFNPLIRDALDLGSGAVLAASFGAAIVGLLVFLLG